jgi:pimeloyl-ACP methyl ester carboxylesterase
MTQIPTQQGPVMASELRYEQLQLQVENVNVTIDLICRDGDLAPMVFLHGFGSTKEDYIDIAYHPSFAKRPFLVFDLPGCGETSCDDLSAISIPFLVKTARAVLDHKNIKKFHLLGHSMGGLTALMLAHQYPSSILSFINIKGNLAPEDCFLSRQIITHSSGGETTTETFFEDFIQRTRRSPSASSALYAIGLRHKVRVGAVSGIFRSMVHLSDTADLLEKFLALPFPRVYMYGTEYSSLSYLERIEANGVELAEIPYSGHFPMYSNPVAMWEFIAGFYERNKF